MKSQESFLEIIEKYLNSEDAVLPVFNKSIERIQEKIDEDEPDLVAVEDIIGQDPAFMAHVLKSANTAFFKGLKKVSTVNGAVIRIGTGEIAKIAYLLTNDETRCVTDEFILESMEKLWQHSIGCAIGARWVAEQCGFEVLAPKAFISGLLHDVGKLLLIAVIEDLTRSGGEELIPSHQLISEVMENFHSEHGYRLLKNWNLPEEYCRAARDHHQNEVDQNDTLLNIVRLVNKACNKLGLGMEKDHTILLAATAEANMLGLSEVFLAKLEIKLEDSLNIK